MDFKNYAGGKKQDFQPKTFNSSEEEVADVVNKYAGKSNDVLMNDIVKMVTEQRNAGKLSDKDLDTFAETAGKMMSPTQQSKLRSVIKQLKGG